MADEIKGYESVWKLKGIPSFEQFYNLGIREWNRIYRGDPVYKTCYTIGKRPCKEKLQTLNAGNLIARELSNFVWAEGVSIDISDGRVSEFVQKVLAENNFGTAIRNLTERAFALGGAVVSAYADKDGKIRLNYVPADKFIPISWDNSGIKEGVFIEKKTDNGLYYTKLEFHTRDSGVYTVSNRLFCSERQDILGEECPLSLLYEGLAYDTRIENLKSSLFHYFSPAGANTFDINSPLGMSVFANSTDTVRFIDEIYDSYCSEMKLGRRRIAVPSSSIRPITQPDGTVRRFFNTNDSVYEAFDLDGQDSNQIKDLTVPLRVNEHIEALNSALDTLCVQTGLTAGTVSFKNGVSMKTATEVVSENSKTFRTIKNHQGQLAPAIKGIIESIADLGALYGIGPATDFETEISFADNIIEDSQTRRENGISLVNNGLMSKYTFLTEIMKMTPENARREIALIENESKNSLEGLLNNDSIG